MRMQIFLGWIVGVLVLVQGAYALPVHAAQPQRAQAEQAVAWLVAQQAADGSFDGDPGVTADGISALVALGSDPSAVQQNGTSPLDYLGAQASAYAAKSVAGAGKLTLAVVAAGANAASFGGTNLVDQIQQNYDAATGQYGASATDHVFAMLAQASTGQPIPAEAIAALEALQLPDGGWSYDGTAATGSDTNTTALAVQALVAARGGKAALPKAQQYLASQQNGDGGFPYSKASSFGSDSDANSTANVIQALVALGVDPATLRQGDATPLTALVGFQNASGALRYQDAVPEDNALATAQAVPALLLKAVPLKTMSVPQPAAPASAPQAALPNTGGDPVPLWPLAAGMVALLASFALRLRLRALTADDGQ